MINIREISSTDTFQVRHPVLRDGKPLESCAFTNDNHLSTIHFGLFDDDEIAGVASLFHQNNDLFHGNQHQLRGMAVLDNFRRKGYGEALLKRIEEYAMSQNSDIIWFNARENAVPFYSALNYTIADEPFVIEGIGIHYIMYKKLT